MNSSLDDLERSLIGMKDPEIDHLLAQNQTLSAELAQCQADKDFVWSLWKKLQVSNPDVTEAISLVIQREKEKSESKDRKVLEIIQVKDDRIEELQNIVAKQSQEISDALAKKVELTERISRIQLDNDRLQEKVNCLQLQIRSEENKEKSLEDTFRRTVEGTEKEKYELNRRLSRLTSELEVAKSEKIHAVNRGKILEERIRTLEREVTEKMVKFEELVKEVEDSSSRLSRYESQMSQQRRELEFKNQELENVRKELKELWTAHNQLTEHSGQQADLIRQLQSLQQDTQKMMKNQEDAFNLESTSLQQMFTDVNSRYESAKKIESELRQQVLELKKSLMDKDDIISALHQDQAQSETRLQKSSNQPDYSGSFLDIVQEVDSLASKPSPRNLRSRARSLTRNRPSRREPELLDVSRSRSLSPPTRDREVTGEPVDLRKIAQLQRALELKTCEANELRRAHNNRLERLRNLQASYRLARQELKTYEFGSSKAKTKKPKRANPRSLQNENSDEVWNELSYFKAENRALQVDKMSLQEEVDLLRVQTSQDAASLHELKVTCEAQKEEFDFQLRCLRRDKQSNNNTENQMTYLKSQLHNKTVYLEKLERDMTAAVEQRNELAQEKSKLMSQLVSTQQEASQHRMELADVKHQLQSARHELEELQSSVQASRQEEEVRDSAVSAVAARLLNKKKKKKQSAAKKYQESLNKSIEEMSSMFDDFNDEGWEEISDSENEEEESDAPSSLGDVIAKQSSGKLKTEVGNQRDKNGKQLKPRRVPTKRPPVRSRDDDSPPVICNRHSSPNRHVTLREFATSPISFMSASSTNTVPQRASVGTSPSSHLVVRNIRRTAAESRQLASLRQRITHLQQQVAVLKKAKTLAVQNEEGLKQTVVKLQAELSATSSRLRSSKQLVQKLQGDLEQIQKEKQSLENQSSHKSENKPDSSDCHDAKMLEAKLKVATSEVTRLSASFRSMKTDNEGLQEQVRQQQDRINHLERDVNQKRNLLESQRIKMKHVQDLSKADANNVEELQTKVKLLTDTNNKLKVQIDSLKKRISLVMKEKKEYEEKFIKVSLELDQKSKQLQDSNIRRAGLEAALTELETSAQQQLHGLATQSEAAIDSARDKLTAAQLKISRFQALVKILGTELLNRAERARNKMKDAKLVQERSQREEDLSLQRAQDKARDILNLSHSDLEDIMSADGDAESQDSLAGSDKKSDKRWLRKCEKLMNSKEDFVHPLTSLLLQKADERADILMKLPRTA